MFFSEKETSRYSMLYLPDLGLTNNASKYDDDLMRRVDNDDWFKNVHDDIEVIEHGGSAFDNTYDDQTNKKDEDEYTNGDDDWPMMFNEDETVREDDIMLEDDLPLEDDMQTAASSQHAGYLRPFTSHFVQGMVKLFSYCKKL